MNKVEELKKSSLNAHIYMKPNLEEDASTRWINKKEFKSTVIYDGSHLNNLSYKEDLDISLSKELVLTNETSLKMKGITTITKKGPRPTLTFQVNLNNLNWEEYNRLSFYVYPKATGFQNFYFHFGFLNNGIWKHDAPSLTPNKWNHVVWEIGGFNRSSVEAVQVSCFMMGTPSEALPEIEIFVDRITTDIVELDHDLGWNLDERIAFSHVGYFPNQQKTAITGIKEEKFYLKNLKDEIVLEKETKQINNDLGYFTLMDFSEVKTEGEYYLEIGNKKTKPFEISKICYDSSIWKSLNFLRLLRCGEDIDNVHSPCHLHSTTKHPSGKVVPNFGGWHDAGDVSQFEICTAEMAHAIIDLALTYKDNDNDLYIRLLEEAKVGINWTLRTSFGDGQRALAILYNVWRDNVLSPTDESYSDNVSENGPFENFIAASALAKASYAYKELDPVFSDWCKRVAINDFFFGKTGYKEGIHTKRWGPNIDSQVSGRGILAACELYLITKDEQYLEVANEYANIVLSCQEKIGLGKEKIRGFFYEDPKHEYMLTYEHRGHEQEPIQGLVKLLEVYPNNPKYQEIKEGILLYKEYVEKTINDTYPYGMLPGHIYVLDKINMERFTVPPSYGTMQEALVKLKEQAKHGRKICENVYLRKFPVSIQRRGFHATLLSKTKAVSTIAKLLNDQKLKQIVIDQFEWVFGKNPFASSTMYGEGYNYHPLYVAFSPQMVGALPVGIETKEYTDEPYWPMATQAVYKEIWGHTTGKYLWIMADIISMEN